jgi:hypothetical protein
VKEKLKEMREKKQPDDEAEEHEEPTTN